MYKQELRKIAIFYNLKKQRLIEVCFKVCKAHSFLNQLIMAMHVAHGLFKRVC